jgi:chloride channel 2
VYFSVSHSLLYNKVWFVTLCWYGMVWYGMVWYGMVWYGMSRYVVMVYDIIWFGWDVMVRYGKV